jgi:hypothetical protein
LIPQQTPGIPRIDQEPAGSEVRKAFDAVAARKSARMAQLKNWNPQVPSMEKRNLIRQNQEDAG